MIYQRRGNQKIVQCFRWGVDPVPTWYKRAHVNGAAEDRLKPMHYVYQDLATGDIFTATPVDFLRMYDRVEVSV